MGGTPIENQNLAFEGVPLDDPLETLGDRGVKHGDVVDLLDPLLAVNVKTPDGSITHRFIVKPSDAVQDLKNRIETDVDIPVDDQKIVYKGKPLNNPNVTVNDLGISDGDTLHLNCKQKKPNSKKAVPDYGNDKAAKSSKPVRVLNPDSAWVYPTNASAPTKGELGNLQGVWSTPTKQKGTNPVEVNIHPKHKEPKSDGKNDIHGAYGYVNGAKPGDEGVVDPQNILFYPPGTAKYRPDFEQVGWWSAPQSSSTTQISWKFVGNDCVNVKTHTVNVMGHEMTFVTDWTE